MPVLTGGNYVMKIGIIGSGQIGGALTRRLRAVGHEVAVANSRGPASLAGLADETGARATALDEVVQGRDILVFAITLHRFPELPANLLAAAPAGLVVIDTSNYYPQQRDGRIGAIEDGQTESGWVEQRLGRPVVKVFNSILAQHLLEKGQPAGMPGRIALAISGDDPVTKATVRHLVDEIGFDGVDAGGMEQSWRQQPGSPGYLKDGDVGSVRQTLADASRERKPEWRATPNSPGTFEQPA